jgi:hypothetical protein
MLITEADAHACTWLIRFGNGGSMPVANQTHDVCRYLVVSLPLSAA